VRADVDRLVGADLEEPFFARIEAARLRQEAKMKEIKEEPVAEASTATKPAIAANSTLAKRPLANGSGARTTGAARPPITQARATATTTSQTRLTRPTSTQSRITTTRPITASASSTIRPGSSVRKPVTDAAPTTRTTAILSRKPPVPTARSRDQTTTRPVSSIARPGSSTTTLLGSRVVNRSTNTTKPVVGAKKPVSGRTAPNVSAKQEEKTAIEVPSIEVFEVADVGSDFEKEIATLDFVV
jgi:hypothetical protein